MAFAAVSCLIGTLEEDLLRFTFLALEIKDLQSKIRDEQPSDKFIRDSVQKAAAVMLMPMRSPLRSRLLLTFTKTHPFLSRMRTEISEFREFLLFILAILKDSASITHDEKMLYLERRLKELAYRMEDMIE